MSRISPEESDLGVGLIKEVSTLRFTNPYYYGDWKEGKPFMNSHVDVLRSRPLSKIQVLRYGHPVPSFYDVKVLVRGD